MPDETGKKNKPPPERAGPLRIDLPFEDAVRVALEAKPPKPRRRRVNEKQ